MLALIVEDEPSAARRLSSLLKAMMPSMTVEVPVGNASELLGRLSREPEPDLVFMDVQLGEGTCFELAEARSIKAPIIFTTASSEFALDAFAFSGIDYVLKPIRQERLAQALLKWVRLAKPKGLRVEIPGAQLPARAGFDTYRRRFLVQQGDSLNVVPVGDIAYFQMELVVRLVTRSGRGYPVSHSLDDLQAMLDPELFFRLNRQVLANIESIAHVRRGFKGKLDVELRPPLSAASGGVSQERASLFRRWLGA